MADEIKLLSSSTQGDERSKSELLCKAESAEIVVGIWVTAIHWDILGMQPLLKTKPACKLMRSPGIKGTDHLRCCFFISSSPLLPLSLSLSRLCCFPSEKNSASSEMIAVATCYLFSGFTDEVGIPLGAMFRDDNKPARWETGGVKQNSRNKWTFRLSFSSYPTLSSDDSFL